MAVKFKTPPIKELIISTFFNPPLANLRSEHIGLLWAAYKKEYPIINQQVPIAGMLDTIGPEVFPMPRYWFISEDEVNLIQVQKNAFIFNWRRRNGDYPHFFENLKPAFDKNFSVFEEFARAETETTNLPIDLCELTYVNAIERCEYWSGPADTPNVIPSFCVPDIGIDATSDPSFNCVYAYPLDADLQIKLTVRDAQKTHDPEIPVLIFEIKASGRMGQVRKSETDGWFERAHDAIIDCFVGMTNRDIQIKYWNRVEETE